MTKNEKIFFTVCIVAIITGASMIKISNNLKKEKQEAFKAKCILSNGTPILPQKLCIKSTTFIEIEE